MQVLKIDDQTRRLIGQSFSKTGGDISPSVSAARQGHKALEKAAGVRGGTEFDSAVLVELCRPAVDHNIYMTPHDRKGPTWERPDKGNLTGRTAFAPSVRNLGEIPHQRAW
ncbi:hypothetical protein C8J56DRAFT_896597 [Mycena floridula]|nr:hypothetical protein C8J56DRAFT_896597 [Mycena floridula]